jgi:hypothetical protein
MALSRERGKLFNFVRQPVAVARNAFGICVHNFFPNASRNMTSVSDRGAMKQSMTKAISRPLAPGSCRAS